MKVKLRAALAAAALLLAARASADAQTPPPAAGNEAHKGLVRLDSGGAPWWRWYIDLGSIHRDGDWLRFDALVVDQYGSRMHSNIVAELTHYSVSCGFGSYVARTQTIYEEAPGVGDQIRFGKGPPADAAPGIGEEWRSPRMIISPVADRFCQNPPGPDEGGVMTSEVLPDAAAAIADARLQVADQQVGPPMISGPPAAGTLSPASWMLGRKGDGRLFLRPVALPVSDGRRLYLDVADADRSLSGRVLMLSLHVLPKGSFDEHAGRSGVVAWLSLDIYDCQWRSAYSRRTAFYNAKGGLVDIADGGGFPRHAVDSPLAAAEIEAACADKPPGKVVLEGVVAALSDWPTS